MYYAFIERIVEIKIKWFEMRASLMIHKIEYNNLKVCCWKYLIKLNSSQLPLLSNGCMTICHVQINLDIEKNYVTPCITCIYF